METLGTVSIRTGIPPIEETALVHGLLGAGIGLFHVQYTEDPGWEITGHVHLVSGRPRASCVSLCSLHEQGLELSLALLVTHRTPADVWPRLV